MDDTRLSRHCPRCGAALAADAAEGLCAACLLAAAAESLTEAGIDGEAPTVRAGNVASPSRRPDEPSLVEGRRFGPYRIGRLLGRGGMGEVYEAEYEDTGRRVALKVLRGRMHDAEDRARFLYEGRLAASVSHPHAVYIYGSEEIDGLPIITMELLPGGTLKDLVAARGPLTPSEAVGATLDLIGGLDAAQAAGILHRDIKPSNCFVDADGKVKVGDFGLSISTLARDAQPGTSSGFQGTPQFAAPEQLLGRPLDVRADIYAVGATLFYLLTGQPPVDAPDLATLVKRVTTEPPRSPRAIQSRVPAPLAEIVIACLATDPAGRPATYAALAERLRPFSASVAQPARLGFRLIAGLVDAFIIGLPFGLQAAWTLKPADAGITVTSDAPTSLLTMLLGISYYLILEGRWSASFGKRLLGLRVVSTSGVATFGQIVRRTVIFYLPGVPAIAIALAVGNARLVSYLQQHPPQAFAFSLSTFVFLAALFITMRARNGWAGLHDLASGTRVVARPQATARQSLTGLPWMAPASAMDRVRCGPFDVTGDLGETTGGRLLAGFDPVLRRQVWLRAVPAGTPPIPPARRDLARPARLRWLAGRRGGGENWDAFEAPDGRPLVRAIDGHAGWPSLKAWLVDLAAELAAAAADGTLPPLYTDRVWIRQDGRAVLLDVPAPGTAYSARALPSPSLTPVGLLGAVARDVLGGHTRDSDVATPATDSPTPIPVSARELIRRWLADPSSSVDDARRDLAVVATAPDVVPRWRRALPLALAGVPFVVILVGMTAALPMFRAMTTPARFEMFGLLAILDAHERGEPAKARRSAAYLRAVEIYLAGRHGDDLLRRELFGAALAQTNLERLRPIAQRVAAAHPHVSEAELAAARAVLADDLAEMEASIARDVSPMLQRGGEVMIAALLAIYGGIAFACSLASALIVPGGVVSRLLGLAAVTRDGVEIARWRSAARVLAAWAPLLAWMIWLGPSPVRAMVTSGAAPLAQAGVVMALLLAGAAWTLARPARGPHDRLTGVWVVPR